MKKSFLRVEDWAPVKNVVENPYWKDYLRVMDEFEDLIEKERMQINETLKEQSQKRQELIKCFNEYKRAVKYQGQLTKSVISIFDNQKTNHFFAGYYQTVEEIIMNLIHNPTLLAHILSQYKQYKKYNSLDFAQNLIFTIYPTYFPHKMNDNSSSRYLTFIEKIVEIWDYSIEQGRPMSYTIIDQVITGFMKSPEIICYVQRICMSFMKEINKCKMDFFAFDEEAVRNEMEVKKSMALSQNVTLAEPKSRWSKLTSYFRKKKQSDSSFMSQTSEIMDHSEIEINVAQIMRKRQHDFIIVVRDTVQTILKQQPPFLLKKLMQFFHKKISKQLHKQKKENQQIDPKEYYKHYCYFLMTNFIFEELHNKFTISHEDTGMSPADLQNITEILRIMSNVFQAQLPEGEKYKNQNIISQLKYLIPKIPIFYEKMVYSKQVQAPKIQSQDSDKSVKEILLNLHQNTLILSFNDIRILIDCVKSYLKENEDKDSALKLSEEAKKMKFLLNQKTQHIFSSQSKRIEFYGEKHDVQNMFLTFYSHSPTLHDVYQFFLGAETPLNDLSVLTHAFMHQSKLTVSEALELTKSLNTIKSLQLRERKYFMNKLALRYKGLYVKDNQKVLLHFHEEVNKTIEKHLIKKSSILIYRQEILHRMGQLKKIMQFYGEELQTSQFYDRISQSFIQNMKIKIIMNIENDELRVYSNMTQLKGLQVQGILLSDTAKLKGNDDYILRHSFKTYSSIRDLLHSISSNPITKAALTRGRRVDEFNSTFEKMCNIILSYVEEFISKKQELHNLNKQRLGKVIIGKVQDFFLSHCKSEFLLEEDHQLQKAKKQINVQEFFEKDLTQFTIDWQFLIHEAREKFHLIAKEDSVDQKLKHFQDMFLMVFSIIGFTMPKNKISAQIINPIIQYVILKCPTLRHYENLYCLQCLKWNSNPSTIYNVTVYQSSLHYISKIMTKDFPL